MTEIENWIVLNFALYLNAAKANELLSLFDFNPVEIFKRNVLELSNYIGEHLANRVKNSCKKEFILQAMSWINSNNISIIRIIDKEYPLLLKEIYDPPFLIFAKGDVSLLNSLSVAIVGGRKSSEYGNYLASDFAEVLSNHNVTIVSGFARGIDTSAHKSVLKNNFNTVAVLGCGLNIVYPKENEKLFNIIQNKGLVISEFPYNAPPLPQHFPYRNRIVSAISRGVLVIEARKKSGALITANMALDQGKDLWVIPARPKDKSFEGGNYLIQAGAKAVLEPKDILFDLNIKCSEASVNNEELLKKELSYDERKIWDTIKDEPILADELTDLFSDFEPSRISYYLLHLEMKKLIKRLPGNYIIRLSN